jgi:hypothetical protein
MATHGFNTGFSVVCGGGEGLFRFFSFFRNRYIDEWIIRVDNSSLLLYVRVFI